jgi:hypothetical protein
MIQDATLWVSLIDLLSDVARSLHVGLPIDPVLAQQIPQTDLMGDVQRAFDNFVKTGQAWAFLIGLVLGYMLKTFTTFG